MSEKEFFKNQKEMMQALLGGQCIVFSNTHNYYRLENGNIINQDGENSSVTTGLYSDYSIYEPPKKKKTITLYRYTYKMCDNPEIGIRQTNWVTTFPKIDSAKFLKTETKEIEIVE